MYYVKDNRISRHKEMKNIIEKRNNMRRLQTYLVGLACISAAAGSCIFVPGMVTSCTKASAADKEPLSSVSFERVSLEDEFWLERLRIQKKTLVPFSLSKTEPVVENLKIVGDYLKNGKRQALLKLPRYVSSDLFKVMEGAACLLTIERDSVLESRLDSIIDIIADAQSPDGYFYELHAVHPSMRTLGFGTGETPYSFVIHSHELYNAGHMYEAAVAYYRATGKRKFLEVAEKNARHINKVFFQGDPAYNGGKPVNQAPGHQEIELALIKLFRVTGDSLYLSMSKKFIDIRGVTFHPDGEGIMSGEYSQQHLPVREQTTAQGHAVRAMYLYSGMADVLACTGDNTLSPALESIWHDIVDKKMHINGGLGSVPGIEGFGPDYELPNKNTYDETCAAVGNVLFNYRMFLASKDARYVDVAEVALYNNVLAGVNLEGNKFFYVNVLEADGRKAFNHGNAGRSPWFGTACCPSNMARLIPQVPGMMYSHTSDDIYLGLYASSSVVVGLESGKVTLLQTTGYPYDGKVIVEVAPENNGSEFTLWMRVPTWATDRFVPGELYRYEGSGKEHASVSVNGRKWGDKAVNGFIPVRRKWNAGDIVTLDLPMEVRYSVADSRVEADSNRICISRGPLVYCAESPDNKYPASMYVVGSSNRESEVSVFDEGILKGLSKICLDAEALDGDSIVATRLTLIPYYAWNNRGDNTSMNVWFARDGATAAAAVTRPQGNIAEVEASFTYNGDDVIAIVDGELPKSSSDSGVLRWTSWPQKGVPQTVTLGLKKKQNVESVSVYWYDDAGGVQVPASWSAEYLADGKWISFPLYNTDFYRMEKNQFNVIHPGHAIEAEAIRLCIQPKATSAVGILEATIE